jgi:hypothetical protein
MKGSKKQHLLKAVQEKEGPYQGLQKTKYLEQNITG